MMMAKASRAMDSYAAAESAPASENLSGYHLYNLPLKTDIKDKQTKQISLLEKNDVAYKKEAYMRSPLYFNYNSAAEFKQVHPDMVYVLQNTEAGNLGLPLPSGIMRFYENDNDGNMQFIGENSISHVAKGEEMRLNLGSFFNVFVSGKIAKISKLSENRTQEEGEACATLTARYAYDAEVTFNNADLHAQEVVFEQNLGGEAKVENESLKGSLKDAGTYVWKVTVPAGGRKAKADFPRRCAVQDPELPVNGGLKKRRVCARRFFYRKNCRLGRQSPFVHFPTDYLPSFKCKIGNGLP